MINIKRFIFLILLFTGFHLTVYAQQESSDIKMLSGKADVILIGKVIQKKSAWNSEKTKIYTKTTVQTDEYLKGNSGSAVEIISLGGEVDGIGELYSHMPKFADSEEVLVFLKKDKMNNYKVLNGEDGKITIIQDEKSKEKMTHSNKRVKTLKSQIKSYIKE